jgi:hypothetical protein
MRLPLTITTTIASAMLLAGSAFADHHEGDMAPPMSPDHPSVVLGPPEGFEPAGEMPQMPEDPDEAKHMALEMFFHFMDVSGNGEVDWDEFTAWVRHFEMPQMSEHMGDHAMDGEPMDGEPMDGEPMDGEPMDGEPMDGEPMDGEPMAMELHEGDADLAHLPRAPECSDVLRESELGPQEEGHPCRDREGNLVFRTICNMPGFESAAITLPAGRAASCFGIEALSGSIAFEIVTEGGGPVWDMSMGPESYKGLKLDEGVYHIRSVGGGDPAGAITIRFVDVATDM